MLTFDNMLLNVRVIYIISRLSSCPGVWNWVAQCWRGSYIKAIHIGWTDRAIRLQNDLFWWDFMAKKWWEHDWWPLKFRF